jgi:hypothetical protein
LDARILREAARPRGAPSQIGTLRLYPSSTLAFIGILYIVTEK